MPTTVRIDDRSHADLRDLAKALRVPITQLLAEMVEARTRQYLLEQYNEAWARVREDLEAWADELEEQRLLDNTLMDGLEDDEYPAL